jgi:hypothetical protein
MPAPRKVTIELPPDLLARAQRVTGAGITQTIRAGLEQLAAAEVYQQLRQLKGKVSFECTAEELKADR